MAWKQDPNDSSKMVPDTGAAFRDHNGRNSVPISKTQSADAATSYDESRSVWVGAGGDIRFTMADGNTADFHNIDDGTLLPIRATQWADLGSGVANILFLY